MKRISVCILLVVLCATAVVIEGAVNALYFYTDDIKPVLDGQCITCHSWPDSYGGLMDKVSSIQATNGIRIIAPAEPDSSVLIWRIEGKLPSGASLERMPKSGTPLPSETITIFRKWIEQGERENIPVGVQETNIWKKIKEKY